MRDLLDSESRNLMIIEDPVIGVFVNELSEHNIYNLYQIVNLIK